MIAYMFWHVPRAGADEAVYAARLARFQEELEQAGTAVTGLAADPVSFRLGDVPWINAGRPVYLDCYLMDGTARMDTLNGAAVNGTLAAPHANIAALYGSGAGSLYGARIGTPHPEMALHAYWFSKPAGMTYPELDDAVGPILGDYGCLLRRMMVLGPSPEFCLIAPDTVNLPAPIVATYRELTAI